MANVPSVFTEYIQFHFTLPPIFTQFKILKNGALFKSTILIFALFITNIVTKGDFCFSLFLSFTEFVIHMKYTQAILFLRNLKRVFFPIVCLASSMVAWSDQMFCSELTKKKYYLLQMIHHQNKGTWVLAIFLL